MSTGIFTCVLHYSESSSGFVPDDAPDQEWYRRFAQSRLIEVGLVRPLPRSATPAEPIWSLVHADDERRSQWCFIEQGRGGAFPASGGCRLSFASWQCQAAEVWRAGWAQSMTPTIEPGHWDADTMRDLLAGIAMRQPYLRLSGSAADNALLIRELLEVLPRRVAAQWVWSTSLYTTVRPFVAGRPVLDPREFSQSDEQKWAAAEPPTVQDQEVLWSRGAAFDRLVSEVGNVSASLQAMVHASRDAELVKLLDTPPLNRPPAAPAAADAGAATAPAELIGAPPVRGSLDPGVPGHGVADSGAPDSGVSGHDVPLSAAAGGGVAAETPTVLLRAGLADDGVTEPLPAASGDDAVTEMAGAAGPAGSPVEPVFAGPVAPADPEAVRAAPSAAAPTERVGAHGRHAATEAGDLTPTDAAVTEPIRGGQGIPAAAEADQLGPAGVVYGAAATTPPAPSEPVRATAAAQPAAPFGAGSSGAAPYSTTPVGGEPWPNASAEIPATAVAATPPAQPEPDLSAAQTEMLAEPGDPPAAPSNVLPSVMEQEREMPPRSSRQTAKKIARSVPPKDTQTRVFSRFVEWADKGNGFARQDDDGDPATRPYWQAAELLLEQEKVPQGVEQTLDHPLWSLRRVDVEGDGPTWCFVERGRGIRLGRDGSPRPDRQFGIAGGCRFGFAPYDHSASEVWRAGAMQAWTLPGQPPVGDPEVVANLLAGLVRNQDRLRLPDLPAANAALIYQLLAVLPRNVAARWIWSTCVFRWADRFVAGAPPQDLQAQAFAGLSRRIAAVDVGANWAAVHASLTDRQQAAFDRLVSEAQRAGTNAVGQPTRNVVDGSAAVMLPAMLDELADRIARELRVQDVPTELLTERGQADLHRNNPERTREWAQTDPEHARLHLVKKPSSAAAPELIVGLLDAQSSRPTENLLGVPTKASAKPAELSRITPLILNQLPDPKQRAQFIMRLTGQGAVLHRYDDLTAAAWWLQDLKLSPEKYLHLFPEQIVQRLASPEQIVQRLAWRDRKSDPALVALGQVPDPGEVVLHAVRRARRPEPAHAAYLLRVLYHAVQEGKQGREPFDRVTRELLTQAVPRWAWRRNHKREQWLIEVLKVMEPNPDWAPRHCCWSVLVSGDDILNELNPRRREPDQRLQTLQFKLLSEQSQEKLPARRSAQGRVEQGQSAQGQSVRSRPASGQPKQRQPQHGQPKRSPSSRQPSLGGGQRWLLIIVGSVVVLTLVAVVVASVVSARSGPEDEASSPAARTSPTRTSAPQGGPTAAASPRAEDPTPTDQDPNGLPNQPVEPFLVAWQAGRDTPAAVEEIRRRIADVPGRPVIGLALVGYADNPEVAEGAAKAVRDGVKRAKLERVPPNLSIETSGQVGDADGPEGHVRVTITFGF